MEELNLDNIESVYMIGIGGIGMSALAQYFARKGKSVSGYDRTESEITQSLEEIGISIHFSEDVGQIPENPELVVYTPAISPEQPELKYCRDQGYPVFKRSDVLQWVTEGKFTIAVAGTHGKTTISTMIAWLLSSCGVDCTAFLGGISANFNSNYKHGESDVVVVEADEYDRSFLKLNPDIAVVSAIEPDHLDIYGDLANLEAGFYAFIKQIKTEGQLIIKSGLPVIRQLDKRYFSYGVECTADAFAQNIRVENGQFVFDMVLKGDIFSGFTLQFPGIHNIENAVAAIAVAKEMGISMEMIKASISKFKGIKRRFEYIIKRKGLVFIDDYAHHPSEIRVLLQSVRKLYPGREITIVFQPHLFSRTRDFAREFGESLSLADRVILLPVYPAREKPIEGIDSSILLNHVNCKWKSLVSKSELIDIVRKLEPGLILTVGAGDIDRLITPLKKMFLNQ
jgi:UDP-N-acetylmuramate--alanine ligase